MKKILFGFIFFLVSLQAGDYWNVLNILASHGEYYEGIYRKIEKKREDLRSVEEIPSSPDLLLMEEDEADFRMPLSIEESRKNTSRKRKHSEEKQDIFVLGEAPNLPPFESIVEHSFFQKLLEFNLPESLRMKQIEVNEENLIGQLIDCFSAQSKKINSLDPEASSLFVSFLLDTVILGEIQIGNFIDNMYPPRKKRARKAVKKGGGQPKTAAEETGAPLVDLMNSFLKVDTPSSLDEIRHLPQTYTSLFETFILGMENCDESLGSRIQAKYKLFLDKQEKLKASKTTAEAERLLGELREENATMRARILQLQGLARDVGGYFQRVETSGLTSRELELTKEMSKALYERDQALTKSFLLEQTLRLEVGERECFSCVEKKKPALFFTQDGEIRKGFCHDCARQVVEETLYQVPKTFGVVPEGNGQIAVQESDLVALGVSTQKAERWQILLRGGKECLTPNCKGACVIEKDGKGECFVCHKETCVECNAQHKGKTCEEYMIGQDPTLSPWMYWLYPPTPFEGYEKREGAKKVRVTEGWEEYSKRFFRICFRCMTKIQHRDACLHMTCSKCLYSFDYLKIYQYQTRYPCNVPDKQKYKEISQISTYFKTGGGERPYQFRDPPEKFMTWHESALKYLEKHPDIREYWEHKTYEGYGDWLKEHNFTPAKGWKKRLKPIDPPERPVKVGKVIVLDEEETEPGDITEAEDADEKTNPFLTRLKKPLTTIFEKLVA